MKIRSFLYFFSLLVTLSATSSGFEIMPLSPYGGAYNKRTNMNLENLEEQALEEKEAGRCFTLGWQVISRKNYPVHEAITRSAKSLADGKEYVIDSWLSPLIAGSIWNDDPGYLMRKAWYFDGPSSGIRFLKIMHADPGPELKKTVTWRSHYGDLQFLHSMTPKINGSAVSPDETRAAIYHWLEMTYSVAIGNVPYDTPLSASPYAAVFGTGTCSSDTDPSQDVPCTVLDLFDTRHFWRNQDKDSNRTDAENRASTDKAKPGALRDLAKGAFLHTIQDSFSRSHVQHDETEEPWRTIRFYSYHNALHCVSDMALGVNMDAIKRAARYSNQLLVLMENKAPWSEASKVVEEIYSIDAASLQRITEINSKAAQGPAKEFMQ